MPRGNGERVGRCADRSPKAGDATVAEVVCAEIGRIVYLIVGDAFDVSGSTESSIDRDGVTTRRAAGVGEVKSLIIVRSRETASRARLTAAVAWTTVAADAIGLCRITRR